MKYKGEIVLSGNVVGQTIIEATHPSQIARQMTQVIKRKYPKQKMFILFIANERGEVWMYGVKKIDETYNIKPLLMQIPALNTNEIYMVFSGNKMIKDIR